MTCSGENGFPLRRREKKVKNLFRSRELEESGKKCANKIAADTDLSSDRSSIISN